MGWIPSVSFPCPVQMKPPCWRSWRKCFVLLSHRQHRVLKSYADTLTVSFVSVNMSMCNVRCLNRGWTFLCFCFIRPVAAVHCSAGMQVQVFHGIFCVIWTTTRTNRMLDQWDHPISLNCRCYFLTLTLSKTFHFSVASMTGERGTEYKLPRIHFLQLLWGLIRRYHYYRIRDIWL